MIGLPGIEKRLARYPQLYSRVGFVHQYRPLGEEELRFVLTHKWAELGLSFSLDDYTDAEALAAITRITGGNFRLVQRLFSQIERILRINALQTITQEVAAAAISRFASLLDGLWQRFVDDSVFAALLERDLATGRHLPPAGAPDYFTTAYFHRPGELADELTDVGFAVEDVMGVEGPGWLVPDFDGWWGDDVRRERLLGWIAGVEREPELMGVSAHVLAIGSAAPAEKDA